ncbi:MAG: hypothetical protein V1706_12305 [Pseudomonadota bacterium]
MKKRKLFFPAVFSCLLFATGTAYASFIHAPHDAQHGIGCIDCHEFSLGDFTSWGAPQATIDDTVKNFICLRCHGPEGSAPTKAMHSGLSLNGTATWTTECVDCHDPHFQRQLHRVADLSGDFLVSDLYLVTGTIDSITPVGANTAISYTLDHATAKWTDPATWSAKTAPGRGLIFVADALNPKGQTFETLAADASTMTVMGSVDPAMVDKQFGLLYGQFIKNRIENNLGGQTVNFFNPFGGYVEADDSLPPTGICQACHTNTLFWTNDGSNRTHYAQARCTLCHDAGQGFKFIGHDHSQTVLSSTECRTCHSEPDIVGQIHFAACETCHSSTKPEVVQAIASGGPAECVTCHGVDYFSQHDHDHSGTVTGSAECISCHEHSAPQIVSGIHNNTCTTCHANSLPPEAACVDCHGALGAGVHVNTNHTATLGSDWVLVFAQGEHDSEMDYDGEVYADCRICHNTDLKEIHDNNCSTCHPTPFDTLQPSWTGGCQQGGCHTTYHENVSDAHNAALDANNDNCTPCHGPGFTTPTASTCQNCHNVFSSNDHVAPVTTSDVQTSYIGQARIAYTITDSGKVGVGTTYSIVDGGVPQVGSTITITSPGSHSLVFWSVDQAGNIEAQHSPVNFTIVADTTPPSTTSNVQSEYDRTVVITLNATDTGTYGVKATHYTINGGPAITGNTVIIAALPGENSYTLQFWSEDWAGNVEAPSNPATFKVFGGTVMLKLVWGDSDITGSPCTGDPEADAVWIIRHPSRGIVAQGSAACADAGGWSGVNDVVVPVSITPYSVSIDWYDSWYGWWDQTYFGSVNVRTNGAIIRLPY